MFTCGSNTCIFYCFSLKELPHQINSKMPFDNFITNFQFDNSYQKNHIFNAIVFFPFCSQTFQNHFKGFGGKQYNLEKKFWLEKHELLENKINFAKKTKRRASTFPTWISIKIFCTTHFGHVNSILKFWMIFQQKDAPRNLLPESVFKFSVRPIFCM